MHFIFALDDSNSMSDKDGESCSKWENLIIAFEDFIDARSKQTGGKYPCDIVSVLYHTGSADVVAQQEPI